MATAASCLLGTKECPPVRIGPSRWYLISVIQNTSSTLPPCCPEALTQMRQCEPSIELGTWQMRRMGLSLGSPLYLAWFGEWVLIRFMWCGFSNYLNMRYWLQGDNCPKEVRNSLTGKWLCLLSQAGYFVGASHHHMMVGHTHEDIGWTENSKRFTKYQCFIWWTMVSTVKPVLLQTGYFPWSPRAWMQRGMFKPQGTSKGQGCFWYIFKTASQLLLSGSFFSGSLEFLRGRDWCWRFTWWTLLFGWINFDNLEPSSNNDIFFHTYHLSPIVAII